MQSRRFLFTIWLLLWAALIPFSFWYYSLRQSRFDYPIGGDAIMIPVMQEGFCALLGAIVSSVLLALCLIRHPLPVALRFGWPRSTFGWTRTVFLMLWLTLLIYCAISSIPDGDEGPTVTCLAASSILLIFLAPPETKSHPVLEPAKNPLPAA